jgi:hypothetical protein
MAVTYERKRLEIKGHISLGRGSPHLLFLQLTSSLHRRDWCCERRRRLITESGEGAELGEGVELGQGVGSLSALGSVLVLLTPFQGPRIQEVDVERRYLDFHIYPDTRRLRDMLRATMWFAW